MYISFSPEDKFGTYKLKPAIDTILTHSALGELPHVREIRVLDFRRRPNLVVPSLTEKINFGIIVQSREPIWSCIPPQGYHPTSQDAYQVGLLAHNIRAQLPEPSQYRFHFARHSEISRIDHTPARKFSDIMMAIRNGRRVYFSEE